MNEEDKEKQVQEILSRYRSQIEEIKKEFRREVQDVLNDVRKEKLAEVEARLDIRK